MIVLLRKLDLARGGLDDGLVNLSRRQFGKPPIAKLVHFLADLILEFIRDHEDSLVIGELDIKLAFNRRIFSEQQFYRLVAAREAYFGLTVGKAEFFELILLDRFVGTEHFLRSQEFRRGE